MSLTVKVLPNWVLVYVQITMLVAGFIDSVFLGGKSLPGVGSSLYTKYDSFAGYQVSLIDNVHSDVARLRGFYGDLRIDR
jgi:hypothetical protein